MTKRRKFTLFPLRSPYPRWYSNDRGHSGRECEGHVPTPVDRTRAEEGKEGQVDDAGLSFFPCTKETSNAVTYSEPSYVLPYPCAARDALAGFERSSSSIGRFPFLSLSFSPFTSFLSQE
jgi:hypothetical protein